MDNRFLVVIITVLLVIKYKLYQSPPEQKFEDNRPLGFLWKEIFGEVTAGKFYYPNKIEDGKNLYLVLDSLVGDSDLYISYSNYPLTSIKDHEYSSYSCGSEQIPLENTRPAFIGIFCYSLYENCTFRLEIYKTNVDLSLYSNQRDKHLDEPPQAAEHPESEIINLKYLLLHLLQIVFEVLF